MRQDRQDFFTNLTKDFMKNLVILDGVWPLGARH
jgi:hypothetical protein